MPADGLVESMKGWIVTKCKGARENLRVDTSLVPAQRYSQVVTPTNIPEFTIPGTGETSPKFDEIESFHSVDSLSCSGNTSPSRLSPQPKDPYLLKPGSPMTQTQRSTPVSPVRSCSGRLEKNYPLSSSETTLGELGRTTNEDPLSLTALSLPHLKTLTVFGFETLRESPNTRRKESLFHCDSDSSLAGSNNPYRVHHKAKSGEKSPPAMLNENEKNMVRKPSYKRRDVASVVAPLGVVLPPQQSGLGDSPQNSSIHIMPSSPDNDNVQFSPGTVNRRYDFSQNERLFSRRRSSSVIIEGKCNKCSSMDSSSSTEPSPNIRRKSCEPKLSVNQSEHTKMQSRNTLNIPNAPQSPDMCQSPSATSDLSLSCSCQSINNVETQAISELGEVKFAVQYTPGSKQLCVQLLKAENLGKNNNLVNVNAFAKLCLMPGKTQKQISNLSKQNSNPVYNQAFYFKNLTLEQIYDTRLRIKFYHKSQTLRREVFLGEVQVVLGSFNLLQETRMWKQLDPKSHSEVITFIHFIYEYVFLSILCKYISTLVIYSIILQEYQCVVIGIP